MTPISCSQDGADVQLQLCATSLTHGEQQVPSQGPDGSLA